jgi:hypothetical protein
MPLSPAPSSFVYLGLWSVSVLQDALVFFLMLTTIGHVYLTTCLTLSPKAYFPLFIQVATQKHDTLQKKCCFYVTSLGLFVIPKRPRNVLPASHNKQWTAGDSDLPGLKDPGFRPGHYSVQLNPIPPTGLL